MSRRTLRTFAQATTCLTVGVVFTAGCLYAAQPDDLTGPVIVPSSGQPSPRTLALLTPEQIDVLTESESPNHPWEQCTIDGELITCPDGYTTTWQSVPDTATRMAGAFESQSHLRECPDTKDPAILPCRVPMAPTYVVGGDGTVHNHCLITLVNADDSMMVCRDDTVWPS